MEDLDGSGDKNHIEETADFDTAEFLAHQAEIAERRRPLDEVHRLCLRAKYRQDKGELWGSVLAYQEALALLPYTPLSLDTQDVLSSRFASRIEELTVALSQISEPWPGEPAKPEAEAAERPTALRRLVGRLGLAAILS